MKIMRATIPKGLGNKQMKNFPQDRIQILEVAFFVPTDVPGYANINKSIIKYKVFILIRNMLH